MQRKILFLIAGVLSLGILFAFVPFHSPTVADAPVVASTNKKPYAKKASPIDGPYPVKEVVDGDTIKIRIGGKTVAIRILGIDTPEKYATRTGYQECYGQEASDFAKKQLAGQTVTIETDSTQDQKDKYGRILAHVFYSGGLYYEEESIRNGFGFRYVYKKPTKYDERLKQAEMLAKNDSVGVWKYCEGKRKPIDKVIQGTKQAVDSLLTSSGSSVTPTPLPISSDAPIVPAKPAPDNSDTAPAFSCQTRKYSCKEMKTCDEARFYLKSCGRSSLDGNRDGTPCDALCK
jgi:micrococcal nuclease